MTTLYKSTKTGATQQWSIEVQGDSFICTYGQLDGKLQSQTTKCEPKNIGQHLIQLIILANTQQSSMKHSLRMEYLLKVCLSASDPWTLQATQRSNLWNL